jgi:hypothetical protein
MKNYFDYIENVMNIKEEKYGKYFWSVYNIKEKINSLYKLYENLEKVNSIVSKKNKTYQDKYLLKNILQNEYSTCPQNKFNKLIQLKIDKLEKEVFSFLDKFNNPYEIIFDDFYFFKNYAYEKGYYPYKYFGINKITLKVAGEYAMYKIKNPT